jgi:hypothetical protein
VKFSEIHRSPGFYGWIVKSGSTVAALFALWQGLTFVWDHTGGPIAAQLATEKQDRARRFREMSADLDSVLAEVRATREDVKRLRHR